MTFVLILTLFGLDSADVYYAVGTNMSAADCEILLDKQQILLEQTFNAVDFTLTCETDQAHE
jgi:hypothetical protein